MSSVTFQSISTNAALFYIKLDVDIFDCDIRIEKDV